MTIIVKRIAATLFVLGSSIIFTGCDRLETSRQETISEKDIRQLRIAQICEVLRNGSQEEVFKTMQDGSPPGSLELSPRECEQIVESITLRINDTPVSSSWLFRDFVRFHIASTPEVLTQLSLNDSTAVRCAAGDIIALRQESTISTDEATCILKLLEDSSLAVTENTARGLVERLNFCQNIDPAFQQQLCSTLVKAEDSVAAVLWAALCSCDQNFDLMSIAEADSMSEERLTTLVEIAMTDKDIRIRTWATEMMRDFYSTDSLPRLAHLLVPAQDQSSELVSVAIDSLLHLGRRAVPVLLDCLRNEDEVAEIRAAWLLGELAEFAPEAVPTLIDGYLRKREAVPMFEYPPPLERIGGVESLVRNYRVEAWFRYFAAEVFADALHKHGITAAREVFERYLRSADRKLFDFLSESNDLDIDQMINSLGHEDVTIRKMIRRIILRSTQPDAKDAILRAVNDSDSAIQSECLILLAEAKSVDDGDALKACEHLLMSPKVSLRARALWARSFLEPRSLAVDLKTLDSGGRGWAMPTLVAGLRDVDIRIQSWAAQTLGEQGSQANACKDDLIQLALATESNEVRQACKTALANLSSQK